MGRDDLWLFNTYEDYQDFLRSPGFVRSSVIWNYYEGEELEFSIERVWKAFEESLYFEEKAYKELNVQNIQRVCSIQTKEALKLEIFRLLHSQLLELLRMKKIELKVSDSQKRRVQELENFYTYSRFRDKNEYSWIKVGTFIRKNKKKWGEDSTYLLMQKVCVTEAFLIIKKAREDKRQRGEMTQILEILKGVTYPYIRVGFFDGILENKVKFKTVIDAFSTENINALLHFVNKAASEFFMAVLRLYQDSLSKRLNSLLIGSEENLENIYTLELTKGLEKAFYNCLMSYTEVEKKLLKFNEIENEELTFGEQKLYNQNLYL